MGAEQPRTTVEDRRAPLQATASAGFSLVELLVVVTIISILAAILVPGLVEGLDRARQRRTMADMRRAAEGNAAMFVDAARYASNLTVLEGHGYVESFPETDGWGTSWDYDADDGGRTYRLRSFGSDGAPGPPPPDPWAGEPYEADLAVEDGAFTSAPK